MFDQNCYRSPPEKQTNQFTIPSHIDIGFNFWDRPLVQELIAALNRYSAAIEAQAPAHSATSGSPNRAKGGHARAAALSPEQRTEIARIAAQTRWSRRARPKPAGMA